MLLIRQSVAHIVLVKQLVGKQMCRVSGAALEVGPRHSSRQNHCTDGESVEWCSMAVCSTAPLVSGAGGNLRDPGECQPLTTQCMHLMLQVK